jgi:hypothetical protein
MRRMDERITETAELPQPVDLATSNGLGFLMRERRRLIGRGTTTALDVLATISGRSRAATVGRTGRPIESPKMGGR